MSRWCLLWLKAWHFHPQHYSVVSIPGQAFSKCREMGHNLTCCLTAGSGSWMEEEGGGCRAARRCFCLTVTSMNGPSEAFPEAWLTVSCWCLQSNQAISGQPNWSSHLQLCGSIHFDGLWFYLLLGASFMLPACPNAKHAPSCTVSMSLPDEVC